MKRLGLLLLVTGLAGGALATANAGTNATPRVVCHRTSSATKPYVKLAVSARQLRTHLKHAADIIRTPLGACPKSVMTPTAGGRALTVALTGEAESPAGDPVGTGTSTIRLRAGQGQVCYRLSVENLAPAAAAHIHRGASGVAGPVVVPLTTPGADGESSGCAPATRAVVSAILAQPASYYVNVHTAEFPAGVVRGQLTGTSTSSFGWVVAVDLKGTSEPNATGDGRGPGPPGRGHGLLQAARCERHAPDRGGAHPPWGSDRERAGRRPLHGPRRRRQLERLHERRRSPDRGDHRQSGRVLRQRPHEGASRRRHPRAARLTPTMCPRCGRAGRAQPERSAARIATSGAGFPVHRSNDAAPCARRTSSPSTHGWHSSARAAAISAVGRPSGR